MIKRTMFVLAVPHLDASAEFYRDALGFEVHEIGDPGWRILERDGCRIMVGECPDAIPPAELGDHSYYAYFVVDDVAADYRRATDYGAEVLSPVTDKPWGMREFSLRTADGHRIMFGQPLGD